MAAARGGLRECVRRLHDIQHRCGVEAGGEVLPESTGEAFADRAALFKHHLGKARVACDGLIDALPDTRDRIEVSRMRNAVRLPLHVARRELTAMRELATAAEFRLAKAEAGDKAATKVAERRATRDGRKRLTDEAFAQLAELEALYGQTDPAAQAATSDSVAVREAMLAMRKHDELRAAGGAGSAVAVDNEPIEIPRLEDDPRFAEQMRTLRKQRDQVSEGLDRLSDALARLHDQAVTMGEEMSYQDARIEAVQQRMADQEAAVRRLSRRVRKVANSSSPLSLIVNGICFVILLGLIGYLVFYFGLIKV